MITNIELPDIGDFDEVEVIEILVKVGDTIAVDDSIITLESDKASMEIPSTMAGIVKQIRPNLGDKIKQGDILIEIETTKTDNKKPKNTTQTPPLAAEIVPITVPDIGDFDAVEVIEILVNVGDTIAKDDSIITLESDKASMEIPTPIAGTVQSMKVNLGDKLRLGDVILEIKSAPQTKITPQAENITKPEPVKSKPAPTPAPTADTTISNLPAGHSHASPSIRKLARELGVDLSNVSGTGQKNRVLESDLKSYVKQIIIGKQSTGGLPKIPVIDFSKFGDTEIQPLSRINKISSKHLSACWLNIPHVTQFDEVNITKMEAIRQTQKAKGVKLTPLVFIMQAVVQTLKDHPRFNASLDELGENLILKKYLNLGIAMDTPKGLVVPVIRDVGQKSLTQLADELRATSIKARAGKLTPADIQGAGFTISSLGGIGGTQFSPIVNAPEVAILGVSRTQMQPIWDGKAFQPTLMLPLALSYDHRVIDGAQGGRFMAQLNTALQEVHND